MSIRFDHYRNLLSINKWIGARSKIAQYMLVDLGFNNTKNFEGGFNLFQAKTLAEQTHLAWRLNPVTVNWDRKPE